MISCAGWATLYKDRLTDVVEIIFVLLLSYWIDV